LKPNYEEHRSKNLRPILSDEKAKIFQIATLELLNLKPKKNKKPYKSDQN
jgi:hypothetical protein